MYYSKPHLTSLYKKYFYGEPGENEVNINVTGDANQRRIDPITSVNSTEVVVKNSNDNIPEKMANNSLNTSKHLNETTKFSFQIKEDVILGKKISLQLF